VNEAQLFVNEAPTLVDEIQRLADETPTLVNEIQPLMNETPTLAEEDQPLTNETQRLTNETPMALDRRIFQPFGGLGRYRCPSTLNRALPPWSDDCCEGNSHRVLQSFAAGDRTANSRSNIMREKRIQQKGNAMAINGCCETPG